MSTTSGTSDPCGDPAPAADPFVANHYHPGMLMGVDDFATDQAYHRGKVWLHDAWLHGGGTVWGLGVSIHAEDGMILVAPGLAVDHAGRELILATGSRIDVGAWYEQARQHDLDEVDDGDGGTIFTAHVILCADACLFRPVPSIADPDDRESADSRRREQGTPTLVAGPARPPRVAAPRLRRWLGLLDPPSEPDPAADAVITAAGALPPAQARRSIVRGLVALDAIDARPADDPTPFPVVPGADAGIVLAQLRVHLLRSGGGLTLADDHDEQPPTVDNAVRSAHVDAMTLLDVLAARPDGAGPAVAPQVIASSASISGSTASFEVTRPLDPITVTAGAFSVTRLTDDGWLVIGIVAAGIDDARTRVSLTLDRAPGGRPVRIVAEGAGPTPLLGTDGAPLSGVDVDGLHLTGGADAALMVPGA